MNQRVEDGGTRCHDSECGYHAEHYVYQALQSMQQQQAHCRSLAHFYTAQPPMLFSIDFTTHAT